MSIPDRRTVLRSGLAVAALGAVGAAAGCTTRPDPSPPVAASPARRHLIGPRSPQVAAAEAARHATGTVQAGVAPEAGHVDLGGPVVATWSFGGQIPGPEIRVRKGQILQALLVNGLPVETTVHWHGVAIRNDMDGMARYDWGINGQAFDMSRPGALQFLMAEGQRVRVIFANTTTMYHPMHIHGHTFQLGPAGPRKDTVIVRPGQQVACDFDAANPGQWMTHCHNLYHAPQGGMMAMLSYQT